MSWIDTRDMIADGLTKGCVDRMLLHLAMDGKFQFIHELKVWSRKQGVVATYEPPSCDGDDKELDALFLRSASASGVSLWVCEVTRCHGWPRPPQHVSVQQEAAPSTECGAQGGSDAQGFRRGLLP